MGLFIFCMIFKSLFLLFALCSAHCWPSHENTFLGQLLLTRSLAAAAVRPDG